jgi:acyl-CoA synthetase (AMP-forming)/AMP-acid ligase II
MSHGEQLARLGRKFPDKVGFRYLGRDITYAEIDARVNRVAHALAARGIGAGDRVALLMKNSIELVEAVFGVWRLGAIAVPVNFRLAGAEVDHVLADSGAAAVVVDADLAHLVAAATDGTGPIAPSSCLVVAGPAGPGGTGAGNENAAGGGGRVDYGAALAAEPDGAVVVDVPEHDPAVIMYTSGTTGRAKGATLSHFNLTMSTTNSMIAQGINASDEVWLANLPLFHISGLAGILPYSMVGGTSVIIPSGNFDPAAAVDDLERHGITGCCFMGAQWQQIVGVEGVTGRDFALRRIVWGASAAVVSVLERMAATFPGVPLYNFFGQTEMSPVTCQLPGADFTRKKGSVGRPTVNVEARIVDDDMHDVAPGEVGEIVYRGPTVMLGYWNRPEATAEAFAGGWFHSGDLCRRDDEGYIYVVDRKKDMIISGGENIYSAEVENAFASHPGVAEVAVIGVPDERWGETPLAVVVPADPAAPPAEADLIAHCRDLIASYKKPSAVAFVDALPRNASGKVVKPVLRAQHVPPDPAPTSATSVTTATTA